MRKHESGETFCDKINQRVDVRCFKVKHRFGQFNQLAPTLKHARGFGDDIVQVQVPFAVAWIARPVSVTDMIYYIYLNSSIHNTTLETID